MMRRMEPLAIWVEIAAARGSTPRDAGTAMKVTADGLEGTIGGGALEYRAIEKARAMLASGQTKASEKLSLGPGLGQCCGGAVTLHYTDQQKPTDIPYLNVHQNCATPAHPRHLWVWGAGHVGRAVIHTAPPQEFRITWVDSSIDRFPAQVADRIRVTPAADMPRLARRAPIEAQHLIFTYSHDIDFALCAALLERGAAGIGLIGSDTKKARFFKRLRALGLDPSPIICPIGDKSLGKTPQAIATGTINALLSERLAA